jgi:muramoyltetrapeptide carboxypeptidase LdcA involved in peptidoglycan recycling
MIIIVSPSDISPLVNDRAAFVAVQRLREMGYEAFVGERGTGSAGPRNVDPAVWRDCVERVVEEIRKGTK